MDPLAWIRTSTRRRRRGIHEKEKVDGDDVAFCILHFSVIDTFCLSFLRRSVNFIKEKKFTSKITSNLLWLYKPL